MMMPCYASSLIVMTVSGALELCQLNEYRTWNRLSSAITPALISPSMYGLVLATKLSVSRRRRSLTPHDTDMWAPAIGAWFQPCSLTSAITSSYAWFAAFPRTAQWIRALGLNSSGGRDGMVISIICHSCPEVSAVEINLGNSTGGRIE